MINVYMGRCSLFGSQRYVQMIGLTGIHYSSYHPAGQMKVPCSRFKKHANKKIQIHIAHYVYLSVKVEHMLHGLIIYQNFLYRLPDWKNH